MFIAGKPAMKVGSSLIVADVHIGIAKDIQERGIHIPAQSESLAKRINDIGKYAGSRRLVLLGDVKHRIPVPSYHEGEEIRKFFSLLRFGKIIILKGNHDGRIENMVPEKVEVRRCLETGGYAFTHGHMNISTKKKTIVIGHNQPHVEFRDELGARYTEPVWVRGPLRGAYKGKNIIMMPAFNELAGATIVNKDRLLGPIAKCVSKQKAHCYLLDGTDLGAILDLGVRMG